MSAYAGFCPLTDFDLYTFPCLQIFSMYAESTRRDLHYRILAVSVKVFVKSAFAGVVKYPQLLCGLGKRGMRIIAYRPIAHCRKHYRRTQFELRRKVVYYPAACVSDYFIRFTAKKYRSLHWLSQRIYGRIGDLRSVDKYLIPIYRQRLRISHR